MKIKVDDAKCIPFKKHHYDAGFDLKNAREIITLAPYREEIIYTGVRTAIPEGHVGLVVPRSSMGKKGMVLLNTIGVIDAHYRGEIMVLAKNVRMDTLIQIEQYERFAQLIIVPVFLAELEVVEDLDETERGIGGFGSTGC